MNWSSVGCIMPVGFWLGFIAMFEGGVNRVGAVNGRGRTEMDEEDKQSSLIWFPSTFQLSVV